MTNETRKELIKLNTELFKFLLVAVLAVTGGLVSLTTQDELTRIEKAYSIGGAITLPILVALATGLYFQIRRLARGLS